MSFAGFYFVQSKVGTARPVDPQGSTEEPAQPTQILVLSMNQATGPMTDEALNNHGTVIGGLERHVGGITSGSSFSAAGDGAGAGVMVPHILAYQQRGDGSPIEDFTVFVPRQRDTDPAVGNKFVCCSKDGAAMPGGWSIEEYNDGGNVKVRGYIQDSTGTAKWIDGGDGTDKTGVGDPVAAEVAAAWAMTYEQGVGAKLWRKDVNGDVTLLASQAACNAGLSGNTADVWVYGYNGGLASYDGMIDDFLLYDGALDQTALENLDDPVSITHGDPPPSPDAFTCLARTSGTLNETHKDQELSATAAFQFLNSGGATRYDCTGMIRTTPLQNPPGNVTWTGKRSLLRIDGQTGGGNADHNGACVSGGAFICPNMTTDLNWDGLYQSSNGPVANVTIREATVVDMLIEGLRAHGGWDGFQNGSGTRNTCSGLTLRKWAITMGRDDAIENDNWWPGIVADACFYESYILFSCGNTGFDGSSRINDIQNCLTYSLPVRIGGVPNRISGRFFKLDSRSVQLRIIGNIFAVPAHSSILGNVNNMGPFSDLVRFGKLHPNSGNNLILWLGSGAYPYSNPDASRFTVQTGSTAQNTYAGALAAFWASYPGHRFSFDPAAP